MIELLDTAIVQGCSAGGHLAASYGVFWKKKVSSDTPPVFLWHTSPDDTVPVENSILFFQALHELQIPVEMHIYPVGGHGLSLANEETSDREGSSVQKECQSWIRLAIDWVKWLKTVK